MVLLYIGTIHQILIISIQASTSSTIAVLADLQGASRYLPTLPQSTRPWPARLRRSLPSHYLWDFPPDRSPHVIVYDIGGLISARANILHSFRYASLCLVDVVAVRPFGSPFFRLIAKNQAVFNAIPGAVYRGIVRGYYPGRSAQAACQRRRREPRAPLSGRWDVGAGGVHPTNRPGGRAAC